jgi:hypothetical protein
MKNIVITQKNSTHLDEFVFNNDMRPMLNWWKNGIEVINS